MVDNASQVPNLLDSSAQARLPSQPSSAERPRNSQFYTPRCLTPRAFAVLHQVIARLLLEGPCEDTATDPPLPSERLAARLESAHSGHAQHESGDPLQNSPAGGDTLEQGLQMLDRMAHSEYGEGFVEVSDERQEFLLAAVQHGNVRWEGPEPVRWFEELLSEATELYIANAKWVSHPQNQAAATQREGESPDRKLPAA